MWSILRLGPRLALPVSVSFVKAVARLLTISSLLERPERLYLAIGAVFGLAYLALMPPMAMTDEPWNFVRAYEVATGNWTGSETLPEGLRAFREIAFEHVKSGEPFTSAEWRALAGTPLLSDQLVPHDNPTEIVLRIHNPLAYIPYAPSMWAGLAFDLPPIAILYLCRATTLILGLCLMFLALRSVPARHPLFLLIALTPTAVCYLGTINIDAFLTGVAFLFCVRVSNIAGGDGRLDRASLAQLAALGALFGVFKAPYILLPLLAVLIPVEKFGSMRAKARAMAVLLLPGLAIALVWALVVKTQMIGDLTYSADGRGGVRSGEQLGRLLVAPWEFLLVLFRTIANPDFVGQASADIVAHIGWRLVSPPVWIYVLWFAALVHLASGDRVDLGRMTSAVGLGAQTGLFVAIVVAALFFLYLQWSPVGSPSVVGFQGRYLLPTLPLLLYLPFLRIDVFGSRQRRLGCVAVCAVAIQSGVIFAVIDQFH
ncbi:MAG: DUF2142 domain-containing protein [Kiloniellales bacterium]|nr:DUF2142 domain-containing protein [Kiloniellales bacterium]